MLLQNFSNTLQVVFADAEAHSMQPVSPGPSASAPQAAACSCNGAAASNDRSAIPSGMAHSANSCVGDPTCQQTQQPAHSATLSERSNSTGATQAADGGAQCPSVPCDASLATASSEGRGEAEGRVTGQIGGYRWQLPAGVTQDECIMLWVGPDTVPTLTHLHLAFNK